MPYTRAVPFSRPPGRRRIEVFSPKIGRRLSLGGHWQWIERVRGQLVGVLPMALAQTPAPGLGAAAQRAQCAGARVGEPIQEGRALR